MNKRGPTGLKAAVVELLSKEPDLNNAEVGRRLNISRVRVQQMRKEAGLPSSRASARGPGWHPCIKCGTEVPSHRKYCSRACQWDHIELICDECGTAFRRSRGEVKASRSKSVLCSRACQGSWLASLRRRVKHLVGN